MKSLKKISNETIKDFHTDKEDVTRELLASKKNNKISIKLKEYYYIMVNEMLNKGSFRNYNDFIKTEMMNRADKTFYKYWNRFNLSTVKFIFTRKKMPNDILKYIKDKGYLIRKDHKKSTDDKEIIKSMLSKEDSKGLIKILKKYNEPYEIEEKLNNGYSYFTPLIQNAFKAVLKEFKRKEFGKMFYYDNSDVEKLKLEMEIDESYSITSFEENPNIFYDRNKNITEIMKIIPSIKEEKDYIKSLLTHGFTKKELYILRKDISFQFIQKNLWKE